MFSFCSLNGMKAMARTSQSLHEIAEQLANRLNTPGGRGHDVSNEPRVPKGRGDTSGEWTRAPSRSSAGTPTKDIASMHEATVTIQHMNGTTEVRRGGTRAWRNNNPGNIEAGHRANSLGAIGSDGRFAIFPDEATGTAAQEAVLIGVYSGKTIDQTVAAWAPEKDGNDTARYQEFVRKITGLSGDRKIGDLTTEERHRLMAAQRRKEGWKPGKVGGT